MGYIVKSACAMVKVGERFVTLDKNAAVPAGADPDHVQVLIDRGMIVEGEPSGFEVDPNVPPPFVVPPGGGDGAGDTGEFPAEGTDEELDAWVAKTKVADVLAYVEAHPETAGSVLAAEKRGKDRKSVVEPLSEGS